MTLYSRNAGRRFRKWALSNLFHQFADMADMLPLMRRLRRGTRVFRNVAYHPGRNRAHRMDIYHPRDAAGSLPVLLYVHGGGFTMCSKETHRGAALIYAGFGFLVCNINYRLAPKHRFPAALEDTCRAYRFVVDHIREYGGDPRRISLAGESAGANLALALTLAACQPRSEPFARMVWETHTPPVSAQVIQGLLQASDPQRFAARIDSQPHLLDHFSTDILRDVSRAYLGQGYRQFDPACELADPLVILERTPSFSVPFPPIFTSVGTADILLDDTRRLEAALRGYNFPVTAKYYPGEPHVFHFMSWRKHTRRFWMDSRAFLEKHGR